MTFKTISVIAVVLACLCLPAVAQTSPLFLSVGGGYSDKVGMTASIGVPVVGTGTYSVTSADFAAKIDPVTKQRVLFTTIRTGIQQVVATADLGKSGSLALAISADAGASAGNSIVGFNASTGGTLVYSPAKLPNLGFYGAYRANKGPQMAATDATVQTAISFGVILKLNKN